MPIDSPTTDTLVDPDKLRDQVKEKYREVAIKPEGEFHFHTGRYLAHRLGYEDSLVDPLPDAAVESFAGVANPHAMMALERGARVVDAGSGAGFDSFIAAAQVGPGGQVIGIDMTVEMLEKSRKTAATLALDHVEFREGLLEDMPVEEGWADILISNGVFNLCPDKQLAFREAYRVLKPGGRLQFADIATGKEVPEGAVNNIDLWTA